MVELIIGVMFSPGQGVGMASMIEGSRFEGMSFVRSKVFHSRAFLGGGTDMF